MEIRNLDQSKTSAACHWAGRHWPSLRATDRDEALATVAASVAAGINFFDLAPMYGNGEAESVVGAAFAEGYPDDAKLSTKCMLGDAPAEEIEGPAALLTRLND